MGAETSAHLPTAAHSSTQWLFHLHVYSVVLIVSPALWLRKLRPKAEHLAHRCEGAKCAMTPEVSGSVESVPWRPGSSVLQEVSFGPRTAEAPDTVPSA